MAEPLGVLRNLTGHGTVDALGCEPVAVRYHVVVERRWNGLVAHGTLHGRHADLRPIWLQPDSRLHLRNGQAIDISLTDLDGEEAAFESTGDVPNLKGGTAPARRPVRIGLRSRRRPDPR